MPVDEPLSMLMKQLAHSVKRGRLITMSVFDGDPITGYVAGWDDEGYLILTPGDKGYSQSYIRKLGNPHIEFHRESTYSDEASYADMDRIIGPFRNVVLSLIRISSRPATDRKAG